MEEVSDDDGLYRRLAPHNFTDDAVNSSAYKRSRKEYDRSISVDVARLVESPEVALGTRPKFGLGLLRAGDVRALGFTVRHQPVPGNDAHALIEGPNSKELADRLARITRVIMWSADRR